jgi:hypothetical protein
VKVRYHKRAFVDHSDKLRKERLTAGFRFKRH